MIAAVETKNVAQSDAYIGLDKREYQANSFLISQRKHMLWVLIRSVSVRRL